MRGCPLCGIFTYKAQSAVVYYYMFIAKPSKGYAAY